VFFYIQSFTLQNRANSFEDEPAMSPRLESLPLTEFREVASRMTIV